MHIITEKEHPSTKACEKNPEKQHHHKYVAKIPRIERISLIVRGK